MRLRPTPKTEEFISSSKYPARYTLFEGFCRQLERELAAAHEECEEQARLLGMSAEREAGLLAKIERLERQLAKLSGDQCPHCGSKEDPCWSRSEPMGYFCRDCGQNVDELEGGQQ